MKLTVMIQKDKTIIQDTESELMFTISSNKEKGMVNIGINNHQIKAITDSLINTYETTIAINFAWDIEKSYVLQTLVQIAHDEGIQLDEVANTVNIPKNMYTTTIAVVNDIVTVLDTFNYKIKKATAIAAKVQHTWKKEIAEIDFFVDYKGAKAVCRWQKRNELLIKKGAVLVAETPLNKDGSIGFAAKFTQSLRETHKDKINHFITTEDIILRSVNEVGNFLYFAGTNSWMILKDKNGKTLDEYTS